MRTDLVLSVANLAVHFLTSAGTVRAVDRVSLTLRRGEVLGLVGESGSGKSVTGHSIMRLIDPPGKIVEGRIEFQGEDVLAFTEHRMQSVRGKGISIVFQDPTSALSPTLSIGEQLIGALQAHRNISREQARKRCAEILRRLDVPAPEERLSAYPHQLSGGMRQRICIAAAMINEPAVLIADEPTTALDVTTQAQILEEVRALCRVSGTAVIWITHDLSVVAALADRVAVMYAGQIVEEGSVEHVLHQPLHPYTSALLRSIPSANRGARRLPQLAGELLSLSEVATGCRFLPRCGYAVAACAAVPALRAIGETRRVRCIRPLNDSVIPVAAKG